MRQHAFFESSTGSDGPIFDQQVREEDLAGSISTGITPQDLGVGTNPAMIARPYRGLPECIRGTGTTRDDRWMAPQHH